MAVTPKRETEESEVNVRDKELEEEVSLPGRDEPEAIRSEAEFAAGPSRTLKKSQQLSVPKEVKTTESMAPTGPVSVSEQLCELS